MNSKLSALDPLEVALSPDALFYVVQGGVGYKMTGLQLLGLINLQTVTDGEGNNVTTNPIESPSFIITDADGLVQIKVVNQAGVFKIVDADDNPLAEFLGGQLITRNGNGGSLSLLHGSLTNNISLTVNSALSDGDHQIVTLDEMETALESKLDAADYNDRFKGVYLTEAALNSAHPTGEVGWSAQVNEVGTPTVVNYSWDDEAEEWIATGESSGPSNTDELPEGSSNLYFTTARVLATALTGISFLTGGAIVSTDSVLVAFGKIQKQINDLGSLYALLNGSEPINITQGTDNLNLHATAVTVTQGSTGNQSFLTPNQLSFKKGSNYYNFLFPSSYGATRSVTFPDKSGTVAFADDVLGSIMVLQSDYGLSNTTSLQKIFNVGSSGNGSIPVAANSVYNFELNFEITNLNGGSSTYGFGFLGTASYTKIAIHSYSKRGTTITAVANSSEGFIDVESGVVVSASLNTANAVGILRGTIITNAAGNLIPGVIFNLGMTGVVMMKGTMCRLTKIGGAGFTATSDIV